ncbi:PHP domain-containing protein [Streptomyces bacillaris]|uniref:PHP domain-containing protein n=1 Tax=Streptomyces bacillaris TaxID=68179 RepID=UPI0037028101
MRGSVPHLHVSSGFSARCGASHPHDPVARAAERGIGTVALTDRDMVTGTVRFAKAAAAAGGAAGVRCRPRRRPPHAPVAEVRRRTPVRGGKHVTEAPFRATFLARDAGGWARLCRMVSAAHAEAFPAGTPQAASWEMLAQYADEGLMVLLGPASEPLRALAAGRPDASERLLAPWRRVAGGGLRLKIVCWGLPGTGPGSVRLAAHTLALADRLGIPAVLTNAVRRVAVTGMPETYRARHALRDTGLALGIPPATMDRIAKSFPHIRACDIRSALAELPELREPAAAAGRYGPLWELAEGLDALPRGIAMHPCGVILSNTSLLDRLPVQPTPGAEYPMVQADKDDVEDLGLLKLDVLGVRMQSAMAHAVTEIRRTTGRVIDLDNPRPRPPGRPVRLRPHPGIGHGGMFQLESPGQQDLVGRLQPRGPQDVIADISLFRPGPVLFPQSLCPALVVSRWAGSGRGIVSDQSGRLCRSAVPSDVPLEGDGPGRGVVSCSRSRTRSWPR